ncbi:MAG TPA: hypothetical protein VIJ12_09375 [Candidatus Baltobacteraceae bacterium]
MDSLEALRAKIPQFPGYGDQPARQLADGLIRSYVGEALATLEQRHPEYFAAAGQQYQTLVLRTGFVNQVAFRPFEYAVVDDRFARALADEDLAAIGAADRAETVEEAALDAYLDEIRATLDRRDKTMSEAQTLEAL